jgi:hypothetical protein
MPSLSRVVGGCSPSEMAGSGARYPTEGSMPLRGLGHIGEGDGRARPPLNHRPVTGQDGAVTVEFVLTATLLFIILFSVVEFAFIFNAKLIMTGAAREGARRAAVEGGATPAVLSCIQDYLRLGNIDPAEVHVSILPRQASYGTAIRVSLSYSYPIMTALLRPIAGRSITLTAEVLTRGEKLRVRGD